MTKLASSQLPRKMGQQLSSSVALLFTCCGGLGGAGDDEPLPLTSAAAADVAQQKAKRGHGHWLARGGVEEMPRSLKKETLPAPQAELSPPCSPLLLRPCLLAAPAA